MNNQGRGGAAGFGGLNFVVKGIAAGVGLASESIHHRKEKKAAEIVAASSSNNDLRLPPAYEGQDKQCGEQNEKQGLEEGDEEQWDLDDAQELITQPSDPKARPFERDPKKITQHFIDDYPVPQTLQQGKLALPVILPQRRPKNRTRGFIRAYAPDLMDCAINEPMFLDFLDTFELASQASPWLNAINLASIAFMHFPSLISQAASLAIMLTVQVAKNMQSRHRYNSFLDQINDGFYQPRGLYCMVLTWNPESEDMEVGVNLNEMIQSDLTPPEGIAQKTKHSLRPSIGKTNGVAFTQTAPLVFPVFDTLAGNNGQEARTQKEKLKSAKNFTSDYFDRRAQAKHAGENPDSQLIVGPKPTFTSRYSDPNHPSNSGDMLALLTGGKLTMPQRGGPVGGGGYGGRGMNLGGGFGGSGGLGGNRMAMSYGGGSYGGGRGGEDGSEGCGTAMGTNQQTHDPNQQYPTRLGGGGLMGPGAGFGGTMLLGNGIKRILKHHVLYLLVLNMPTDEEMAEATRIVEQIQQHKT